MKKMRSVLAMLCALVALAGCAAPAVLYLEPSVEHPGALPDIDLEWLEVQLAAQGVQGDVRVLVHEVEADCGKVEAKARARGLFTQDERSYEFDAVGMHRRGNVNDLDRYGTTEEQLCARGRAAAVLGGIMTALEATP